MQINTKVQCNIFFSKIFSSSYSAGGERGTKDFGGSKMEKSCISKSTKDTNEIFAPNDSEIQISSLLVKHLLAISQPEKKLFKKNDIFTYNCHLTKPFCHK